MYLVLFCFVCLLCARNSLATQFFSFSLISNIGHIKSVILCFCVSVFFSELICVFTCRKHHQYVTEKKLTIIIIPIKINKQSNKNTHKYTNTQGKIFWKISQNLPHFCLLLCVCVYVQSTSAGENRTNKVVAMSFWSLFLVCYSSFTIERIKTALDTQNKNKKLHVKQKVEVTL